MVKAIKAMLGLQPRRRVALCIWCMEHIPYGDLADKREVARVNEAMKAHDCHCPENPLVQRIKELEARLGEGV